jgi:TonB family protein
MKKWPVAIILVILSTTCSFAEDKNVMEANSILLRAADQETFKVGEAPKFRLEVRFSYFRQGKEEAKGLYVRETDSAVLWHEDLEFGNFNYQRARIRKQIWTRQNHDFVPLSVRELWAALNPTGSVLSRTAIVKRIKNRRIDSVEARCVEYEDIHGNDKTEGHFCVQSDTGYLVYWESDKWTISYSEFSPLGQKVRPRRIVLDFNGTDKIVADVNYRLVDKFDPTGFEPIVGGEVSELCLTSRPPIAKYAPDPVYPLTVQRGLYKGKIIVDVKVAPDGHVLNDAIAQSLQDDLDAAALDGVKKWQFEPGTCNGNAVTSFTMVTATYR